MKLNLTSVSMTASLIACALGVPSASADIYFPKLPQLVTLPPDQIFAPQGFDDNDTAQLTIAGNMPNTCFKAGPVTAEVDSESKTIVIRNQDYYYDSCWCLQVLVPYVKTLELGIIPKGDYKVLVTRKDGGTQANGNFSVSAGSNPGPDDHLYAQINDAGIEPQGPSAEKTLTLSVHLASSCMELSEVTVFYRGPNVIEVLPVVTIEDESGCTGPSRSLKKKVTLSPSWSGQTLVHIRSLNGQALNKITQF